MHTERDSSGAETPYGSGGAGNGFPLVSVRRLTEAVESLLGVRVGFLDASGIESEFDSHGSLAPVPASVQVISPSVLQEAFRRPRPILHRGRDLCTAVSLPFLVEGRLAGFIMAWGFYLPEPDKETYEKVRSEFVIEGWRDAFGRRERCPELPFTKFFALVNILEAATAQLTLLSSGPAAAQARYDGTTPLSWAVYSAIEEIMRATENHGANAEAAQVRDRLEALYNSTQDAILMLDKDLKIVAANREFGRIFGTDPDAFIGVTGTWLRRWVVKNAKEPARVADRISELLANPRAVLDDEVELLSPHYMILRLYSAPVTDKAARIIGRVLVFRDITEFRRARKELIGTEKMSAIGRAAAGLAHELNNILAGVVTYGDYALDEGTPDKMREALKISISAAEKASALVNEFLSVTGPSETLRQDVDLHLEIERLLDSLDEDLRRQNIRVHRLLEAVPRVSVDPVQILRVFHHLVDNARQAIGKDGTITVRTETDWDRGTVRVIVSDSGPGIPPELIDRIFDPFFTTRGVVSGGDTPAKGLGLSIARGTVEAHGGKIYAGNVLPHGASFVVELPLPGRPFEQPPSPSAY